MQSIHLSDIGEVRQCHATIVMPLVEVAGDEVQPLLWTNVLIRLLYLRTTEIAATILLPRRAKRIDFLPRWWSCDKFHRRPQLHASSDASGVQLRRAIELQQRTHVHVRYLQRKRSTATHTTTTTTIACGPCCITLRWIANRRVHES